MFVAAALFGDRAAGVVLRNTHGTGGSAGRGTVMSTFAIWASFGFSRVTKLSCAGRKQGVADLNLMGEFATQKLIDKTRNLCPIVE
jgi:hypothetical protein